MNAQHIKVIPLLQSESGYFLCFPQPLKEITQDTIDRWTEVYHRRFGVEPEEIRHNEVARMFELGPVPNS